MVYSLSVYNIVSRKRDRSMQVLGASHLCDCGQWSMIRFVESFQALHAEKLLAAEERSLKMLMDGDMPPARGKKKLKPMTEVRTAPRVTRGMWWVTCYQGLEGETA